MPARKFTRYYRDLVFRAAVDEQLAQASSATKKGEWITYAIHDPTKVDHIGDEADGLIIYIGQTKEFAKRIGKRLRNAGTATKHPTDRIDGACYEIMRRDGVPRFTVRETVSSAIDSLISETNTVKRLLSRGYPLLNQWTEQKFAGLLVDRHTVPHERLWPITAEDAIGSAIELIARDTQSGEELSIDLKAFPPAMRLREIRDAVLQRPSLRCRLHVKS